MSVLEIKNLILQLKKDGTRYIHNISFKVEGGKSLLIMGQSGSGKSLTVKTIMGIICQDEFKVNGEILLEGKNIASLSPKERLMINGSEIALIPQNPMTALNPLKQVGYQMIEIIRLHKSVTKEEASGIASASLVRAGLFEPNRIMKSYPKQLSGGMLQRVLIAMAVMLNAKFIVADEPTTALDSQHRQGILQELIKLRDEGIGVIIVTHDLYVAKKIGGDVVIVKDGQIIEQGKAKDVWSNPSHPYTKKLFEASLALGG